MIYFIVDMLTCYLTFNEDIILLYTWACVSGCIILSSVIDLLELLPVMVMMMTMMRWCLCVTGFVQCSVTARATTSTSI